MTKITHQNLAIACAEVYETYSDTADDKSYPKMKKAGLNLVKSSGEQPTKNGYLMI